MAVDAKQVAPLQKSDRLLVSFAVAFVIALPIGTAYVAAVMFDLL